MVAVVAESTFLAAIPLLALVLMPLLMIEYVICCQCVLCCIYGSVWFGVSTFSVMTNEKMRCVSK